MSKTVSKIMLADDEDSIRKVVEHIVNAGGNQFCYAANGLECLAAFEQEKPDLLILDVMMPEVNGFEVCTQIREISKVPIIFLSAKGDIVDKSIGFKAGADDYLVKPFSSIELGLRIDALLRRGGDEATLTKDGSSGEVGSTAHLRSSICFDDWEIFLKCYEVRHHGTLVDFTSKEFEILAFLASNAGQVFTREQLLDSVWGKNFGGDPGTITVFIRKIREKIEDNPAKPQHVLTVWGIGYKFSI